MLKLTKDQAVKVVEHAREVLQIEAEGLQALTDNLNSSFALLVDLILASKGRVVVTGLGKSGLVGRKITATLNSTGTQSVFLHPVEAMHGDLGIVGADDVVIAISNSGETEEVNRTLPSIRRIGAKVAAFTGNPDSTLAALADIVVDVHVDKEACPLGLAPTTSTTAALAMGDALAVALIHITRFGPDDFKARHPGGSLGERLGVRVDQMMLAGEDVPRVGPEAGFQRVIGEMDEKGAGATLVVGPDETLIGIVTDGDLRRALRKYPDLSSKAAAELMTPSPYSLRPDLTAAQALTLMENRAITVLPIVDNENKVLGLVHLHDLLGRDAFKAP